MAVVTAALLTGPPRSKPTMPPTTAARIILLVPDIASSHASMPRFSAASGVPITKAMMMQVSNVPPTDRIKIGPAEASERGSFTFAVNNRTT
ncbi:hypothetical protein D3C75_796710 [compost metagenome]